MVKILPHLLYVLFPVCRCVLYAYNIFLNHLSNCIFSLHSPKQGVILYKHSTVISLSKCHAVVRFDNRADHTPYLFSSVDPGVSSWLSPCPSPRSNLRLMKLVSFTCYVFFSLLASGTYPPFRLDFDDIGIFETQSLPLCLIEDSSFEV